MSIPIANNCKNFPHPTCPHGKEELLRKLADQICQENVTGTPLHFPDSEALDKICKECEAFIPIKR